IFILFPVANIHEMSGNRSGCCHGWRYQMRASPKALTAFKVTVRCGSAALTRLQPIIIHGKAHGTAWLAPIKSSFDENFVQAFSLTLFFDKTRSRHDHRPNNAFPTRPSSDPAHHPRVAPAAGHLLRHEPVARPQEPALPVAGAALADGCRQVP